MSIVEQHSIGAKLRLLPFANGDRLDQPTFHSCYLQIPSGVRAELIGGMVFMPSPITKAQGQLEGTVKYWLGIYAAKTPGVQSLGTCSIVLGPEDEPEPDAALQINPAYGGRTKEEHGYVVGAPELVVEVAVSPASLDLHLKKQRYEAGGVDEYLVICAADKEVQWFRREGEAFGPVGAGEDGIYRSRVFPGLWLDAAALFAADLPALTVAVESGVATSEHQAFEDHLVAARQGQRDSG